MAGYLFSDIDAYDTPQGKPVAPGYKLMLRSRWYFYLRNFNTFIRSGKAGAAGKLDKDAQIRFSCENIKLIEDIGGHIHLRGLNYLRERNGEPAVIVANHMSLLETAALHAIIREHLDFSFVVKESLLDVPYFRHILKSMNAIPVSRVNPREDLKTVLAEGKKMLQKGISMVVFPQSTRSAVFDPAQFNSIGVKLAKSAGVPVIPLALKTDMLRNGKIIRDVGPVCPENDVWFEFGPAMEITGNGQEQQQQIIDFITGCFARWQSEKNEKNNK